MSYRFKRRILLRSSSVLFILAHSPAHNPVVDKQHDACVVSVGKVRNGVWVRDFLVLGVDSYLAVPNRELKIAVWKVLNSLSLPRLMRA